MDKPNPTSQVCMSRESHQHVEENIAYIYKNWVQECTSWRGGSIIDLVQNFTQLRWSLERMKIVRLETIRRKRVMSTVYKYIYIHTHTRLELKKKKKKEEEEEIMPCYLTEKEEEKKISCLLQDFFFFFLRSPNLCTLRGKLWIMCGWSCPFIVLVRESLIAIKTHLVKTGLARKRSQNKEEFLYLMEWIKQCEFLCSAGN